VGLRDILMLMQKQQMDLAVWDNTH